MEIPSIEWLEHHCKNEPVQQKDALLYPFLYGPYAFSSTCIEPQNDIHILLDFFERQADFPLVICGNWRANSYAEALYFKYCHHHSVQLLPIITDVRVFNMLRSNCHVFIEPASSDIQARLLYEAMYMQLPLVVYASARNIRTTLNNALYYKTTSDLRMVLQSMHANKKMEIGVALRNQLNKLIEH